MKDSRPIPKNEKERLKALENYYVMDTLPEDVYDNITKLASIICDTPIALISLLDENRQWFKSEIGLGGVKETPREISFCQHAIMGDNLFEVPNALENSLFADNPLVTDNPNIRFYAGTPLKDEDGFNLGTLCVIDSKPKELNETQKEALNLLGKEVIAQLAIRRKNIEFREIEHYYNKSLDLICVAGQDGYFKKINPRFTDIFGFSHQTFLSTPFADFIHKDDLEKTYEVIQRINSGETVYAFRNRFKSKNEGYKHISWNTDTDKETGNMLAVGRDVTEEVKSVEKINNLFQFQNTVLDGTDYSIITTEPDGTISVFNKGAQDLLGYSKEEIVGKVTPAIIHDEQEVVSRAKALSEELGQTIEPGFEVFVVKSREGKPDVNEWTYISKKGKRISVELSVTALKNGNGKITGYLGIAKDLTEEKKKKKKIEDLTKALDTEMKAINDSVLRVELSIDGKIIDANENFCNLIGYDKDNLIELNHSNLISEEQNEKDSYKNLWHGLKKGNHQHGLFKRVTKNGTAVWIRGSYIPVKDDSENVIKVIKIAYDVTESIILQDEIKHALLMAKQATIAKDEFLANMSHEIRTPMNAIVGFTELIESTELNPEQKDYLSSIKTASNSLLIIINDILDFAKIESGQLTINAQPFKINEALNITKNTLKSLAKQKGLALNFYTESDIVSPVIGDEVRLNQVLVNLIGNAIKFTEKGKVEVFTTLENETKNSYEIKFDVVDTGIGIAEADLDKIFSRFKQAEKYKTRKYGGTGLGLSISRKIITALGGNLSVTSELGKGSKFSFTLTFVKTNVEKKNEPVKKLDINKSIKGIDILLVEDNALNQILAKEILSKEGVVLTIAENGEEGVEELSKNPQKYSLVLMDLQMPKMSGYEATKHIRKKLKLTSLPIIAMTAHSLVGEKEKCLSLGMNDYISKPYKRDELISKIQKYTNLQPIDLKNDMNENSSPNYIQGIKEIGVENEEFISEMITIFLKNGKKDVEALAEYLKEKDFDNVAKIAHKLKSSFGIFKITDAYDLVVKLESISKYKNEQDIAKDVDKLEKISSQVFEQLENYNK